MTPCENLVRAAEGAIEQAGNCINSSDVIAYRDLSDKADRAFLAVQECCDNPATLSEDVLNQLYSSEVFLKADLTLLPQDVAANAKSIQNDITFLINILDPKCPLNSAQKQECVSIIKEKLDLFKDYIKYEVNNLIINVDKDYSAEFRHGCSKTYLSLDFDSYVWMYDLKDLESKVEANLNKEEELLNRLSGLVGESNYQLMSMAKGFYSQETTTVATTSKATAVTTTKATTVPPEISQAQSKVDKLTAELESKRAQLRKEYAPTDDLDAEMLWAYMGRNLKVGIYDQALTCLEMYDKKVNSSESDIYIPVMRQYIKEVERGKFEPCGLMVWEYHPDLKGHDFLEIGDIIISIDGKEIKTFDDYNANNPDAEFVVLRMNSKGVFEKKTFILSDYPNGKAPVLLNVVLS